MIRKAKILCSLTALLMLVCAQPICSASIETENRVGELDYGIEIDGYGYEGEILFVDDTAYVSLREFACEVDNSVVSWNETAHEASVKTDSLELYAGDGEEYFTANGRYLWCKNGIFTYEGILYLPLGQLARSFGFNSYYDADAHKTYLTRTSSSILPGDEYYDSDDVYWLSRIICAESGGEEFRGKLAVGNVVINRTLSSDFPSSVYDVIFDMKNGVQFTPTVNGAINNDPDEDCIIAAKLSLEGGSLSDEILYFLNEELSTSLWIPENCTYVMTIGSHDFYTE